MAGPTAVSGFRAEHAAAVALGRGERCHTDIRRLADEPAIYTNALSAATISAHYDAATTNNAGYAAQILGDGPVGYWHFD